jgi:hypothetical protein
MIFLSEFFDMVPPRIVGGDKYSYGCYGDDARFLDLEQNVDLVFDEKTHEVYEISVRQDDDISMIWRSPVHEPNFIEELQLNRNYEEEDLNKRKSNIDMNTLIEQVKRTYESGNVF